MAKTTWAEKFLQPREAFVEVVQKSTPAMKAGQKMLIPTPVEIDQVVRTIPEGQVMVMADLRDRLAQNHEADVTCPLTTGIFLRMAAEYALQEMSQGKEDVMPFWRVVDPKSPLAKKLPCGPELIVSRRAAESSN